MPVGTQGAVKGVTHRDLADVGAEILLSNTYHLYLRPGDDLIARLRRPASRSSAGTSRSSPTAAAIRCSASPTRRTIDEEGARFQSHLDGSRASADAGEGHRHPGAARLGHRDGARRVPRVPGDARRGARSRWSGRCAGRGARASGCSTCASGAGRPASSVTNPGQAQFGIVQGGVFAGSAARRAPSATVGDRIRGAMRSAA